MTFGVFVPPFRPVFDPIGAVAAAPAGDWWTAGGAPTPIAVYQPKGAASLAASYVNLVNPGTYDAAPGTAPSWNSTDGWILDNTHSLLTGISAGPGMSILVRFRNASGPTEWRPVIGDSSTFPRLVIWPSGSGCTYDAGGSLSVAPYLAAGVLGIAGQQGYRNGVADGGTIPTETGTWGTIRVGLIADYGPGFVGNIQAIVIWDTSTDAATWMPEVMAAVALI